MSKFLKIFAVFGLILGFAAPAHAGLVLVLDDGNGNTVTVDDTLVATTDDGSVGYFGSVGDWNVTIVGSLAVDGGQTSLLDTSFIVSYTGDGEGELTITSTNDIYTGPIGTGTASTIANGALVGGTVGVCSYIDGVEISCDGDVDAGINAVGSIEATTSDPYTLSQEIVITSTNGQSTSFDVKTTFSVPEPAVLGLLGFGLFGVGVARRRKKTA